MKRSEMIDLIEAELYFIQSIESNNQSYLKSIAKGILDRIEESGMLPPLNNRLFYLDGDNADANNIIYRQWDLENE